MGRHPICRFAVHVLPALAPVVASGCTDLEPPTAPPAAASTRDQGSDA
jgi:hypothetical protein